MFKKIIFFSILFFLSCEEDPIFGLERGWLYEDNKKSDDGGSNDDDGGSNDDDGGSNDDDGDTGNNDQSCFTNFTVSSPEECYNNSNTFSFSWTGGCEVIQIEYGLNSNMGYFLSLDNSNYTSNFSLYGFGPSETYFFQLHGNANQSSSMIVSNTTSSIDCSGGGTSNSHCTNPHYCSDCDGCESNCCPNYCSGSYYYYNRSCSNGFCLGATSDYCANGCNEDGCL